jgi:hypothetical protein
MSTWVAVATATVLGATAGAAGCEAAGADGPLGAADVFATTTVLGPLSASGATTEPL